MNCQKSEQQIPQYQIRSQGRDVFIYPQYLPVLIHKLDKLADKQPGMLSGKPTEHEH